MADTYLGLDQKSIHALDCVENAQPIAVAIDEGRNICTQKLL